MSQVVHRAVAPLAVEAAHERRAVGGGEHHPVAADDEVPLGVAGMHRELGRRLGHEAHQEVGRDADAMALDVGTRLAPQGRRLVLAEVDAVPFEQGEGRRVDALDLVRAQHLVVGDPALEGRQPAGLHPVRAARRASRPPRLPSDMAMSPSPGTPSGPSSNRPGRQLAWERPRRLPSRHNCARGRVAGPRSCLELSRPRPRPRSRP